jgi:hypothetical protein
MSTSYEIAFHALTEALQDAGHRMLPEERMLCTRTLIVLRRAAEAEREALVVSDPTAVLAAMSEDPQRRELYLGAGGPWCWVTDTNGAFRVSLEDALAMELGGLLRRKWADYPHWWLLSPITTNKEAGNADR